MKRIVVLIIIRILKKLDVSIMLNFKLENNTAMGKKENVFWESNTLINIVPLSASGRPFKIPEGKFQITTD